MENQVFQIQQIIVDKLDVYKERGNSYVDIFYLPPHSGKKLQWLS